MRILNCVLGDASGGRWQVVCQYGELLQRHGHRVLMLVGPRQGDLGALPQGVEVEFVRSHGHYDYVAAWVAARRLRQFRPDLALAHCSRSVALLKRALAGSAPLLAVTHSNKVSRLLPADGYLALNAHIRERLAGATRGPLVKPCFVIPNMIETDPETPLAERSPADPPHLVALGRFDAVKGLDVFLRAVAGLREQGRECTVTLAGSGCEEARLRGLVTRLGLESRVQLPGWIDDVPGLLQQTDLLCVPARADAFGLTPLQGALAGVPMVLSRATGHLQMFEPEQEALFFDIDDVAGAARQMARLIDHADLAERLRVAAYERTLRCYSAAAVTEKILQAVETMYKKWNII